MARQGSKFYNLSVPERRTLLRERSQVDERVLADLCGIPGLSLAQADGMIENVVGLYSLPLAVAQHFVVNGREVQVPMVIEEASVVAGASNMAKLVALNGGFTASSTEPVMIGQFQVLNVPDLDQGEANLLEKGELLLAAAAQCNPDLVARGGGPRGVEVRRVETSPVGPFLVVHLLVDVRDAMGANIVNTMVEKIAPLVEEYSGGRVHLRILSNLADRRLARASCRIRPADLSFGNFQGEAVRDGILAAYAFAAADPYRAATHNKGILNGIDAVVLATGNDWRAIEAGAHAFAARDGRYTSLSRWSSDDEGMLVGELELPLAVGIVGGATQVHPGSRAALELIGALTSRELAEVIAAVGLAQNLAALRALATEGIQRGHMSLHARQMALATGAEGKLVERIASRMVQENQVGLERARQLFKELRNDD